MEAPMAAMSRTLELSFAPEGTVECYSKSVCFVTDLHQNLQCHGITVQEQGIWIVNPDDKFHSLCKTYHHQTVKQSNYSSSAGSS